MTHMLKTRIGATAALLGLCLLASCLAAGAGETKDRIEKVKIGISIGSLTEERWQREVDMFNAYAKKHGFELLVQSAENNITNQIKQCENLVNQNVDVLILKPVDSYSISQIVENAHEEGVAVIGYDIPAMKCDVDFFVTFDSYRVGEVQVTEVLRRAPKGRYMLIKGAPDNNNARLISKAYHDVLDPLIEKGDISLVMEQFCTGWDPLEALRHSENALSLAQNDIQGCVVSNDGMAGAVVQALDAQGLAGKVPVSGQDADLAACQRIVEGTQTVTAYKPLSKVNLAACQLAVAVAMGRDPVAAVDASLGAWEKYDNEYKLVDAFLVDVVPITKENIHEILVVQDKFHSAEDLYRNLPKDQWPK